MATSAHLPKALLEAVDRKARALRIRRSPRGQSARRPELIVLKAACPCLPLTLRGSCAWLVLSTCVHCSTERRPDSGSSPTSAAAGTANAPPEASSAAIEEQDIGGFQPDDEASIGHAIYDPYRERLYEVLFGGDDRRICQLLSMPPLEVESAVYIKSPVRGTPVVVSRALRVQLSGQMWAQINERLARERGASLGPEEPAALLAKLPASTETHVAELDRTTVGTLSRACEAVLQRTHAHGPRPRLDRVRYHAGHWQQGEGHWQQGRFLSALACSPPPGTISSDYVALGERLRSYASSPESEREAIQADLLARAERLIARAKRP